MTTYTNIDILLALLKAPVSMFHNHYLPFKHVKQYIDTYKDYTKVGLIIFILQVIGMLLLYFISLFGASIVFLISVPVVIFLSIFLTLLSFICFITNPLINIIPWDKLNLKIKKQKTNPL